MNIVVWIVPIGIEYTYGFTPTTWVPTIEEDEGDSNESS